jgi:uncharacterized membrane protein
MDLGSLALVVARALHILAGIAWMGATLAVARIILPILIGQTVPSPWFTAMAQRIGPMAMASSIVNVLTGIYLMAVLHRHDTSTGGLVLMAGALAGFVAVPFGMMIGRTVRTQQAHLAGDSRDAAQIAASRQRVQRYARVSLVLLMLSVVGMATFRYASALASGG